MSTTRRDRKLARKPRRPAARKEPVRDQGNAGAREDAYRKAYQDRNGDVVPPGSGIGGVIG